MGQISYRCPVVGCKAMRLSWQLTCSLHWRKVPKADQDKIWKYYKEEKGSARQRDFAHEVLERLNAMEAPAS